MKLLIVDDEKLTREGIRDSIARLSLPFDSILLADDGVHGLETAVSERPDIVLTDVRMPRMRSSTTISASRLKMGRFWRGDI